MGKNTHNEPSRKIKIEGSLTLKLYPPIEIQQRFEAETSVANVCFNRKIYEALMETREIWTKLFKFIMGD